MNANFRTSMVMLALVLFGTIRIEAATVLWVAPDGRDDSAGTADRPFATLARARDAVREMVSAGLKDNVVVRLRGGTYRLTGTLVLTPEDGGTREHSITYESANGEQAILKGSRLLSGQWERVDGTLWKLAVPEAAGGKWAFRQLFRDGVSQQRAREPNRGHFTLKSVDAARRAATLNEPLPSAWTGLQRVELNSTAYWHFNRQPVAAIDAATGMITARRGIGTEASSSKFGNKGHERIWLENALLFADQPGEWFLDTELGSIFYRATATENPNEHTFSAPLTRELILVHGTAENVVRNLRFLGIEFAETDWEMPDEGRLGVQAGAFALDRSRVVSPTAAVRVSYANGIVIERCSFRDLGEGAIAFEIGASQSRVARSAFTRVGSNVVQVGRIPDYTGDRHPLHRDFAGSGAWVDAQEKFPGSGPIWDHFVRVAAEAPSQIEISDNSLVECCTVDLGAVAIWIGYANHVTIAHNLISDLPYTGISVGWRWAPGLTNCHSNHIVGNRIERVMRQVGDGAGIYLVGEQPGTRIIGNYVNGSGGNYWAHGLYTDEMSDHMELTGNYATNIADHSIFMNKNGPHQNVRDNNSTAGPNAITGRNERGGKWVAFAPALAPPDLGRFGPRPTPAR